MSKDFEGLPHRDEDEATGEDHRLELYERAPPLDREISAEEEAILFNDGKGIEFPDLNIIEIPIERRHKDAKLPEKKSCGAAAFDVYAVKDQELKPSVTTVVSLGIVTAIPPGYELKVIPRSGFTTKGVTVRNSPGTIDSDYRGEIGVILQYQPENLCQAVSKAYKVLFEFAKNLVSMAAFDTARSRLMDHVKNDPFQPYMIKKGDRVAQLQLQKVIDCRFKEVDTLEETERGDGGFGSTGR